MSDVNALIEGFKTKTERGTVADIIDVAHALELEKVQGEYKKYDNHPFYPSMLIHFYILRAFEGQPGKKDFIYSLTFEKSLDDMAEYVNTVNFAAPVVRWRLRISK